MRPFLVEIRPYPHHCADSANGGRRRDPRASARLDASFLAWLPLSSKQRWYVVRSQPQREVQATKQPANREFRVFLLLRGSRRD